MNNVYQHYIIDLSSNNNFVQIPTVQGDGNNIRGFEVELIENGMQYVIDKNDCLVAIMGTKPDTSQIMNDCTVSDEGYILVDITSQMSAVKGRGNYQIVLMSRSTNSQLKSFPFHILTTPAAFDIDHIVSSDEFQALTRNIVRTEEVIEHANDAISDMSALESSVSETELIRISNENTRIQNETARGQTEKTRIDAENIRIESEQNRDDAEIIRISNEETRKINETDRIESETDRVNAETDRINAENVRETNENIRIENENNRKIAEDGRMTEETKRDNAESIRIDNESARQTNESDRQTNTALAISNAEKATDKANAAAEKASIAGEKATAAESTAIEKATDADNYAKMSQSYAVGTGGAIRPGDATDNAQFFSELAQKLTEDAQKLVDQAQKLVSAATTGSIIPAGTVMFEELPTAPKIGYMYNISNAFITDSRFVEGAGTYYNPGTNIYWTKDGQWDVMIGVQVTGVKGAAENDYHQGNVNITPASIGLENVNNTLDADKVVKAAGTATKAEQDGNGKNIADTYLTQTGDSKDNIVSFTSGDASNPSGWTDIGVVTSGEKHSSLLNKISLFAKNVRYLWKLLGNTSLSGIGDGTVTGAISALNTGLKLKIFNPVFVPNTYVQEHLFILQWRAGLHIANIGIVLMADIQPWSNVLVANISDWDGAYMLFPITSTQGGNEAFSQTLLIEINSDGTMYISSHGKITNKGWFFGSAVS